MKVVRWARASRVVSSQSSAEFFDPPLPQLTLFSFTTRSFSIAEHGGALSLKMVFDGEERYRLGRKALPLRAGHALVINAGERYASAIEDTQTEALSLFIPEREADSITRWLVGDDAALLDKPVADACDYGFVQTPVRGSSRFIARAQALRAKLNEDLDHVAEQALRLVADGFCLNVRAAPPSALRRLRRPIRDEVMARLVRARDWMHAREGVGCSLGVLSAHACMSSFHFLRRFTEAYGITPAAYARSLRLERAKGALARGASREEAARQAGYGSYDALARAMRRQRQCE